MIRKPPHDTPAIQSLDRGLAILEAVAASPAPVPLKQLTGLIGIDRSSAARRLRSQRAAEGLHADDGAVGDAPRTGVRASSRRRIRARRGGISRGSQMRGRTNPRSARRDRCIGRHLVAADAAAHARRRSRGGRSQEDRPRDHCLARELRRPVRLRRKGRPGNLSVSSSSARRAATHADARPTRSTSAEAPRSRTPVRSGRCAPAARCLAECCAA